MRIMMLSPMRTTLSIDDDLLLAAKQQALADRTTVSDVVNRTLRRGLFAELPTRLGEPTIVYGAATNPAIDDAALRRHTAGLDDEVDQRTLRR